ncbi:Protein kinase domain-containing protein ppk32 [Ophidiomyces ophidiicola]|nr:Protein kinase domain-containing protein ppk32 [Ophidiomyces ophidiicola]KAI1935420.1 Protein kinase domain-containing protein ppk32 [Ophidiomyces ophidiicola]
MFSSALKSFSSNISSNYQICPTHSFTSGPWKVHDGKKKGTGTPASVFIFDRKSLDSKAGGFGSRSSNSYLKKLQEGVIERLKREASNLARLRHPSILQILEPVEDTRNGGLMFVTEPLTASLAGLLQEKDEQERAGGRTSRYVVEASDGSKRRRDLDIDELEIQKGLLQIGKGLEFLHESAALVHGNLTPNAIYINSKSDWKISGLSFSGPADSQSTSTLPPLALSEVLYHDAQLPPFVQLDLDYTSPDFVIDSNISTAADLFSLGLLIIALYNSPHTSPLQSHQSINTYKKLLSSPSTVPSQNNSFCCSKPIPKDLQSEILPRLITRRPAQRMNAREFQQARYFDNVLVSTIRFLESFPAKTPNEKSQFMRGLSHVLPEFPTSVLEKKVLPALLEEGKDHELLPLILQNTFKIIDRLPAGRRVVSDKVLPQLKVLFPSSNGKATAVERGSGKDAGLMVILENIKLLAENCSGKEFKEDVWPLISLGLDSPTHSLVDASLRCLPAMLPVLDFSTVKDEVFPPIALVFSKTSSLAIKIRGLEAFVILCGGSLDSPDSSDDLSGIKSAPKSQHVASSSILDKFTIQEKVVPLIKGIKTKEPAVMMAALKVFKQIGHHVDIDFLALEVLPVMWTFSLGPLLNVQQFTSYMDLIKSLSSVIEKEQTKKLQELSSTSSGDKSQSSTSSAFGPQININGGSTDQEMDFESLVLGKARTVTSPSNVWGTPSVPSLQPISPDTGPKFSWSSSNSALGVSPNPRSITPDTKIGSFPVLKPTSGQGTSFYQQPTTSLSWNTTLSKPSPNLQPSLSLSSTNTPPLAPSTYATLQPTQQPMTTAAMFTIPPPPPIDPQQSNSSTSRFLPPPPPTTPNTKTSPTRQPARYGQQGQGLDKYESLL